jgi:hypothetical protein
MGEPAGMTPSDRLEVRRLSSAILEAVRADESVARAAGLTRCIASDLVPRRLVYRAEDAEMRFTQMAQEIELLCAALVEACDIGQRLATVRTTPFGEDYQRDHAQRLQDIRAAVAGTEGK